MTLESNKWKRIYENYEINESGEVRSWSGRHGLLKEPRYIYGWNLNGYQWMNLRFRGKYIKRPLHALVLESFIGPKPDDKEEVAHWDGNPLNNHISNLRWVTHQENIDDKKRHGTMMEGERHVMGKLKSLEIRFIKYLLKEGLSQALIAKMFKVTRQNIWCIKHNKSWTCLN